jgi:hypothetical protein
VRPAGARRIEYDLVSIPGIDLIHPVRQETGEILFLPKQPDKFKK